MLPSTAEVRTLLLPKCEVREQEGKPSIFCGRAAVYNQWSGLIYGCFRERLAPGAFDDSLKRNTDIVATVDHDTDRILGRQSAKTLRVNPSSDGIDVEVDGSEYTYARDLTVAMKRGDIRGMSFIFDVVKDSWTRGGDDIPERTVLEADIYEVSFVHFPAYEQTEVSMRGIPLAIPVAGEQRSIERAKGLLSESDWVTRARLRLASI